MKLFQLVVESYSSLQLEVPSRKSLISLRDELTAGQAKLLGYLIEEGKDGSEIAQGRMVAVKLHAPDLVRPVGVVHRKRKKLNRAAQAFVELLLLEQPAGKEETRVEEQVGV